MERGEGARELNCLKELNVKQDDPTKVTGRGPPLLCPTRTRDPKAVLTVQNSWLFFVCPQPDYKTSPLAPSSENKRKKGRLG